jgi:hypothetical protein
MLTRLVSLAPSAQPAIEQSEDDKKVATTIRFDARTRQYIEAQADHFGISVQEFVALTFRAIMVAGSEPQSTEFELMVDRFVEVFSSHGIPMADITRMLPDTTLVNSDFLSKKELLNKLDESIINQVAALFLVRPEWLKGTDNKPVDYHSLRLYKNLHGFARKLALHSKNYRTVSVIFIAEEGLSFEKLLGANKSGDAVPAVNVGVIIEMEAVVNGISYRRYEVGDLERWNYWRCRHHLKALMMFCEKSSLSYSGVLLSRSQIEQLFYGKVLPIGVMESFKRTWYPDQFLWEDERNTELFELDDIKKVCTEAKVEDYATAIQQPYRVQNWSDFAKGDQIRIREESV